MFTLNISMKLILQLSLIVILWNHAVIQVHGGECVSFKNIDLRIPEGSSIVVGEKNNDNDSWYHYLMWLQIPGSLTLNASIECTGNKGCDKIGSSQIVTPLLRNEGDKWNGFCGLLRKALGLNNYYESLVHKSTQQSSNKIVIRGRTFVRIDGELYEDAGAFPQQSEAFPDQVEVPSNIFTDAKCLEFPLLEKSPKESQYRILVEVVDDQRNTIITGHLLYTSREI